MDEVTRVLSAIEQGDPQAAEQLLPLVYDELRRLAAEKMAQEKPGQTLQATALVHEAYIRLVDVETRCEKHLPGSGSSQLNRLHQMLDGHVPQPDRPDLRGGEWYYYLSLCHGEVMTLPGHSGPVRCVVWSPDGSRLASASSDRTVRIWNAATGKGILTLSANREYQEEVQRAHADAARLLGIPEETSTAKEKPQTK